jgi:AraC-like DNA-binding protein
MGPCVCRVALATLFLAPVGELRMSETPNRHLSIIDVADLLGVSGRTICREIDETLGVAIMEERYPQCRPVVVMAIAWPPHFGPETPQ